MRLLSILLLCVLFVTGCSHANSYPPDFKAGSNTTDSLRMTYKCDAIEFENWGDNDLTDSTLTIGLINSQAFDQMPDEMQLRQLDLIGTAVKNSLQYPERYKAYYIIFMKRSGKFLFEGTVHTFGSELSAESL